MYLYPLLVDQLTEERSARHYAGRVKGPVRRFEVPAVSMLNFVADGAGRGSVTITKPGQLREGAERGVAVV
jgi:hypothetical protein